MTSHSSQFTPTKGPVNSMWNYWNDKNPYNHIAVQKIVISKVQKEQLLQTQLAIMSN